jgi:hypothetical protein
MAGIGRRIIPFYNEFIGRPVKRHGVTASICAARGWTGVRRDV